MAPDEPSKRTEPLAHRPPARSESGPFYDAFVVRLWHLGTGQLLRAEVEHVQTGSISNGRGVAPAWILRRLRECLDGRVTTGSSQAQRGPEGSGPAVADESPPAKQKQPGGD